MDRKKYVKTQLDGWIDRKNKRMAGWKKKMYGSKEKQMDGWIKQIDGWLEGKQKYE